MARIDDLLAAGLQALPPKPAQSAQREAKKRYSEAVSQAVAYALAEDLRLRGLADARPAPPGVLGTSGAERRMAGGLGSKKVDVTWATPESLFDLSLIGLRCRFWWRRRCGLLRLGIATRMTVGAIRAI